jgi:hypothetical protein
MPRYVNIYSVGQGYGGPEEGGWWFDTGSPIGSIPVELTEQEWDHARSRFAYIHGADDNEWDPNVWNKFIHTELEARAVLARDYWLERYPRTGKRTSVLGGEDYDVVIEDHFARFYPEERPRYE